MKPSILPAASSLVLAGCSVVGIRAGTEEARFHVVEARGPLEIRTYDPRLAAETTVPGTEVASRSAGFRRLAGFIFGNNTARTPIAMTAPVAQASTAQASTAQASTSSRIDMTAPVTQEQAANGWRITFFMPARYTPETLPQPNDPAIRIVPVPAQTVAVYRYTGAINAASTPKARRELLRRLQGTGWEPVGAPVNWFYDPPWTLPFLRRNEAAVPVTRSP